MLSESDRVANLTVNTFTVNPGLDEGQINNNKNARSAHGDCYGGRTEWTASRSNPK